MSAKAGGPSAKGEFNDFFDLVAQRAAAYDAAALPENRGGRLTAEQQRVLSETSKRTTRGNQIVITLGFAISAAAVVFAAFAPAASEARIPALVIATTAVLFPIASAVFLWSGQSKRGDIRSGKVGVVEGPIRKRSIMLEGGNVDYLVVAGKRYRTSSELFNAAPASGTIRLFVLPRSGSVVNWEAVRDHHDE
jgi:hypothetical protein